MISKRTISYIGFWVLILPWLGFSYKTQTWLVCFTGIVLLFLGAKHYVFHNKKNKKLEETIDNDDEI